MILSALLLLLAPAPLLAAEVSKSSRTLVVCDDVQDPMTLDPQRQFSEKNHTLVQQIFEGLVRFGPEGQIEPALATSWKRLDERTMQFQLRRGVLFHNGERFDAKSVKFSIERYLDPKTGFPAYGYIDALERVVIVDEHTVNLVTRHPDGLLLNRLAGFILLVPPKHYSSRTLEELKENPVGSGAFRFERWEKGNGVYLTRNVHHWDKRPSKIDALVFRFVPTERQLGSLLAGEVDIVSELPGSQTTEAIRGGSVKIVKKPTFYTVTGSFNASRGPLKDVRVRRAINHLVDTNDLIRYDLFGNGRPLATVTMPQEEGHNESLAPYSYAPKKAAALLKEAGVSEGFSLKVAAKVQGERAARIIEKQLAKAGIRLDIRLFTDSELIQALKGEEWDMFLAGCPDPMAHTFFIQSIFLYGESPYRVAKNAAYDEMLVQMSMIIDDGARRRKAQELDAYLHKEALLLFLYQRIKTYGVRREASFTPTVTGMPYFFDAEKTP